jgi:hypothetical protein
MHVRKYLKYATGLVLGLLVFFIYYDHSVLHELGRFRRSDGEFQRGLVAELPSREGLDQLRISGSARPTKENLKAALSPIAAPVYVIDIFSKHHYYINGLPEDWFGYKRNLKKCMDRKKLSARAILHRLMYTGKLKHGPEDVQSEKEIVEEIGFNYILFDQLRKSLLSPEQVDSFIQLVNSLPESAWIHFHCSAGRGRTSIAMVMYDILKNGKKVSLEDIVRRQYLLGSENLFDTTVWSSGRYSKKMLEDRKQLIVDFYAYVNSPDGYGHKSWQEWISAKSSST